MILIIRLLDLAFPSLILAIVFGTRLVNGLPNVSEPSSLNLTMCSMTMVLPTLATFTNECRDGRCRIAYQTEAPSTPQVESFTCSPCVIPFIWKLGVGRSRYVQPEECFYNRLIMYLLCLAVSARLFTCPGPYALSR